MLLSFCFVVAFHNTVCEILYRKFKRKLSVSVLCVVIQVEFPNATLVEKMNDDIIVVRKG